MSASVGHDSQAGAKVALIDPAAMRMVWLNDAAAASLGVEPGPTVADLPIESIVPSTSDETPREVLASVADTGEPRHLRSDMLANRRGAVAMLTSIHRLPDGMLLVVTESVFLAGEHEPPARESSRHSRR